MTFTNDDATVFDAMEYLLGVATTVLLREFASSGDQQTVIQAAAKFFPILLRDLFPDDIPEEDLQRIAPPCACWRSGGGGGAGDRA